VRSPAALDLTDLALGLAKGERNARECVEESITRIEARDAHLGCFLGLQAEWARARADDLDRRRKQGEAVGPLCGVPLALKANICVRGFETNAGSKILAGYRPPYTATCVQRLLDAGAIPIGTTNMDEFAMGSSGENSSFGVTRNPWDPERTPGGSSSGSAASVGAGLVPFALGSDTGGSVRQPAAMCGVSGFKPTYGRVSRYGLIAFGSSLDQISPLARSVRDLELVTSLISGHDPLDSTSIGLPALDPMGPADRLDGLRVGVPAEYFPAGMDAGVRANVEAAVRDLEALGATIHAVQLPYTEHAIATYYVIANAEASSNLARYDGVRYGARSPTESGSSLHDMIARTRADHFGGEVVLRILLGTYVLSSGYYQAWYERALKVRRLLQHDFERVFESVDVLACPTALSTAFKLGERKDDPLAMYMSDVCTVPANLAGLPALSVPCGFERQGTNALPVGLQLMAAPLADARLLQVGRVYQQHTEHHLRQAPAAPAEVPA
jgi:aspartyl-tRNA(Asn)/glutamyl-tRNA(Gln) amidotransferase subunit A